MICKAYKVQICLSTLSYQQFLFFIFSSLLRIKQEIHNVNCLQIGNFLERDVFHVATIDRLDRFEIEFTWNSTTFTKFLWCPRPGCVYMHYLSESSQELDKHQLWKWGNELAELVKDEIRIWTCISDSEVRYFSFHLEVVNSGYILESSGSFPKVQLPGNLK